VGSAIGVVLGNVIDTGGDDTPLYSIKVNDEQLCFVPFINEQDCINGNKKKFFSLLPNPTEPLYGYFHYHALLNRGKQPAKGWLGHVALKHSMSKEEMEAAPELAQSEQLVLMNILQDRLDHRFIDGLVVDLNGNGAAHLVKNIQQFLISCKLESNIEAKYDMEKANR
jgi:hypothetical protein